MHGKLSRHPSLTTCLVLFILLDSLLFGIPGDARDHVAEQYFPFLSKMSKKRIGNGDRFLYINLTVEACMCLAKELGQCV